MKEYKKYNIFDNEHLLFNSDFMEVAKTLLDKSQHLIIADPPYFEVKGDFDFIWASFEDYLKDVEKWAIELKRILADNGTLFWWGDDKNIAYTQIILDGYFKLESNLVWWKGRDGQFGSAGSEIIRSFATSTERCLMYSNEWDISSGRMVADKATLKSRDYIRDEIIRAKGSIKLNEINKMLGVACNGGGVASSVLSDKKMENTFITKEQYLKIREWLNKDLRTEYEYLRTEYEYLRTEYEDLRRPFNNYAKLTDVLEFTRDNTIYKHDTKKDASLTRMLVKTCSKKGQNMFVPFGGSGTETEVGINEGLKVIVCEMEEKHCITIDKRIEAETQQLTLF